MLKNAEQLHAVGFDVHWLRPKSKMPIAKNWTKIPKLSLTDLRKSYRKGFNVGVRLGQPLPDGTFLGVIDCDVKNPKSAPEMLAALDKFMAKAGVAYGPSVMSGRGNGSLHVYIRTIAPFHQVRLAASSKLIEGEGKRPTPEWDIVAYSKGRQVVVPPSIHPVSGKAYKWAKSPSEIPIPLMEIKGGEESKAARETLEDWEPVPVDLRCSDLSDNVLNQIISGVGVVDRSAALFGAAIAMKKVGFTKAEILSVLTDRRNFLGAVGFEHRNTNSRRAAAAWVSRYTYGKAEREASSRDDFEIVDGEDAAVDGDAASAVADELVNEGDWRKTLERQQDGKPRNSLKNMLTIFENLAEGEAFIRHDEFSVDDKWVRKMPWGNLVGGTVSDADARRIKDYLSKHFRMEPAVEKILEALMISSDKNKFHPVRDFLKGLKWDKVRRAELWLETYLGGTGPREYVRAVGLKTLVAMVARVFEPGIKFDHVLILEGIQGVGKSSAARILAHPWFSDAFLNVSDKDAVMNMQGTWVNELGELSAMSRSEVNSIKEFVTRQVDKIRPPYGHLPLKYPRQNIFIGTTNNRDYLRDQTGNRRFWPVAVKQLDREGLERDRDQLLAEAVSLYMTGETLYLDAGIDALARIEQGARLENDELEDVLREFLLREECPLKEFNFFELIEGGPAALNGLRNDRATQMRVANLLRRVGFDNEIKWSSKGQKAVRKWRLKSP